MLRRFTAPGASINTGSYESHTVPIRNGRSAQETFSTDVQGFEILPHSSAVADFTDKAEVDAVYLPEVIAFIKERTGADEVVTRGAVLRRSVSPAEHASQPQAALVHIDYGPQGADMTAARVYAEQFPDGPVDRIPDDPLAEVDESKMITSGSEFVYSPDHVWWYFPDMTREEILFFVFHDSDHSRAWRVLHSAFRDPTVEDAVPRHSIGVRSFAFFS